ncbi:glycosyltransferase family 8 protein [Lewinella sp. IMCC34191]|uniref:glycosyltransferase family 8 protein n=1 Tax=Lewinella sp. IMCC34191 TaxID=2259172 RepID=UPI000E24443B|nr:glycosyltransferase family 8 protein [Lewinella sp. IMCC34191]
MTEDTRFHVVFSVNVGGLPGLGATVTSLIQNCSQPERLIINIMCSNMPEHHMGNIRTLFSKLNFTGEYRFIEYDADEEFKGLPRLLGDLTPYGRLLIPDYIDASRVLYLDSDLVIDIDVLPLQDLDMEGHVIAAVLGGSVAYTNDLPYFLDRGFDREMSYFNSGVLLMDIDAWKEKDITKVWRDIVKDRPETIPTVDQTILNRVCGGNFRHLPKNYNVAFLAHYKKPDYDRAVFHFIGSPKPWDFLGNLIHAGYGLWKQYSPSFWEREYQQMSVGRLDRAWNIRRSIGRAFKKRYVS